MRKSWTSGAWSSPRTSFTETSVNSRPSDLVEGRSDMAHRYTVVARALIASAAIVVSAIPAPAQTSASATGSASRAYRVPRTPDGQPDLQGFWTNTTYTPLQRPDGVNKDFFTREEALELMKRN